MAVYGFFRIFGVILFILGVITLSRTCENSYLINCSCQPDGAGGMIISCQGLPDPKVETWETLQTSVISIEQELGHGMGYNMKIWPNLEEIYSKTRHYVCANGLCGDKDHPTTPAINTSLRPRTSFFTEKPLETMATTTHPFSTLDDFRTITETTPYHRSTLFRVITLQATSSRPTLIVISTSAHSLSDSPTQALNHISPIDTTIDNRSSRTQYSSAHPTRIIEYQNVSIILRNSTNPTAIQSVDEFYKIGFYFIGLLAIGMTILFVIFCRWVKRQRHAPLLLPLQMEEV